MSAPPTVIQTNDDGSVLGLLDGKLYRGVPRKIGFDELEVAITVDGDTITKTEAYGGFTYGKTVLDRASRTADRVAILAREYEAGGLEPAEAADRAQAAAEAEWADEQVERPHEKAYMTVLNVDDEFVTVERTKLVYDWQEA